MFKFIISLNELNKKQYLIRILLLGILLFHFLNNFLWLRISNNIIQEGCDGMGLMLIAARRSYKHYLLLLFPTLYYIVMVGFGNLRFYRWLIPILPFEAMLFGVGLYTLYRYLINFNFLIINDEGMGTPP